MRVKIKGVIYETVEDAAKAYNVKPVCIRRAINEGREDRLQPKKLGSKRGRQRCAGFWLQLRHAGAEQKQRTRAC
jgi:hypothetical protein